MSTSPESFTLPSDALAELPGLRELLPLLKERLTENGVPVHFKASFPENGFRVTRSGVDGNEILIAYRRPCDAFRALAHLLAGRFPSSGEWSQSTPMKDLGVMLDVSRNAVLRPESQERLIRHFALLGINTVQLYMEEVYLLPGEPFFGYGRGAYSPEELRRIDDYGARLGIEVIPCIQTLGHLEQILQWGPYRELTDAPGVLMVGDEATYRLTAKMLDAVSASFRTRRVHIGMDEAHGVGKGRYRDLHGERRPFDILNDHLQRITAQCVERGLKPMIWSDMYFRLGSEKNDYYDKSSRISPEIIAGISPEIEMVYWDYYHHDEAFYEEWIDRHRAMGKEPIFASGAWGWGRFWTLMDYAFRTNTAGMRAARRKGLTHAMITVWGDDGAEVHPFSMLPTIAWFAELAYRETVEKETLAATFDVICGESFDAFVLASEVDQVHPLTGDEVGDIANFSKWLLWHDPVLNFLDHQIPAHLPEHYTSLATQLAQASSHSPTLAFPHLLAQTLAGKTRLHLEVKAAYRKKDVSAIRTLLSVTRETQEQFRALWRLHAKVWHEWNKPFGWEVIDRRYAGVASRLERLEALLEGWIADPTSAIEEFDSETYPIQTHSQQSATYFKTSRVISPSHLL